MVCEHLKALNDALTADGVEVIYRDRRPWTKNCRNWTRYKCVLDLAALRRDFQLPDCVEDWEIDDHWQGSERGFVCSVHHDAVIGDIVPRPRLGPPGLIASPRQLLYVVLALTLCPTVLIVVQLFLRRLLQGHN